MLLAADEPALYVAVARAKVDSAWKVTGSPEPDVAPQSHVVNARTNPAWYDDVWVVVRRCERER